jgi:hypothetical protein
VGELVIKATGGFEVPDYSESRPHSMVAQMPAWTLQPGDMLWSPAGTAWDAFSNLMERERGSGLLHEVAFARPVGPDHRWEVVAFGASMLHLRGLDYRDTLDVVLPHVPAICSTCRGHFERSRRAAGFDDEGRLHG